MEIEILTKQDLEAFGQKLLHQFVDVLNKKGAELEKEYLRTKEVRKLLGNISNGTLQNLRIKGLLKPSKIEGVYYYKSSEVTALLNGTGRS